MESGLRDELYFRRRRYGGGGSDLPWATFTGNPLEFDAPKAHSLKSCTVGIEPVQDLHGYANPWPAGGGKNLVDIPTVTRSSEGGIYPITDLPKPISAGEYTVAITSSAAVAWQMTFRDSSNNVVGTFASNASIVGRQSRTATISAEAASVSIYVNGGTTLSQIQCEAGSTASAYSPYSNICPISGWTGANIYDESSYDPTASPKLTVTWQDEAGTVYGGYLLFNEDGSVDLVVEKIAPMLGGGTLRAVWLSADANKDTLGFYSIAIKWTEQTGLPLPINGSAKFSYCKDAEVYSTDNAWTAHFLFISGEFSRFDIRLPKSILADISTDTKAVESANAYLSEHPLQACYSISPVTYHLPSIDALKALKGINTMWTDADNLTVEARAEAVNLNALQSLNILLGNRYVNNHTADDVSDDDALDILLGGQR